MSSSIDGRSMYNSTQSSHVNKRVCMLSFRLRTCMSSLTRYGNLGWVFSKGSSLDVLGRPSLIEGMIHTINEKLRGRTTLLGQPSGKGSLPEKGTSTGQFSNEGAYSSSPVRWNSGVAFHAPLPTQTCSAFFNVGATVATKVTRSTPPYRITAQRCCAQAYIRSGRFGCESSDLEK